jgi:RNA polymerase sigma-70 factor (ECF subfamily)
MRLSQLADRQLVERFQQGSTEAFEELLNRYKTRVFARIRLYVRDKAMAEDIFQDTFIKAIHALKDGQYNEDGKFSSWLLRITTNLCIDNYRNKKKMPKVRETDDFDPFDFIPTEQKNFLDVESNSQALRDVRRLVGMLPAEQKEIVVMRMYYDMSFKEISELLNISINTALGRMRYALINLRKYTEKHHVEVTLS